MEEISNTDDGLVALFFHGVGFPVHSDGCTDFYAGRLVCLIFTC